MTGYIFHPLPTNANNYPKARVPILPVLSIGKFFAPKTNKKHSRFLSEDTRYVWDGRTAIAHALKSLGNQKGLDILLPAYHCGSLVEPCLWLGLKPIFYNLNSDLSINLDDFKNKLSTNTKVALIVHYFGFPQNVECIRSICDETNTLIIEDCAHAFFSQNNGSPVGYVGDIAVASLKKYFPCNSGGAVSYNKSIKYDLQLTYPSVLFNLKDLYVSIENSVRYSRLKLFKPFFFLLNKFRELHESDKAADISSPKQNASEFKWFSPDKLSNNAPLLTRYLATHGCFESIYKNRRSNFVVLLEGLANLRYAKPLFDSLPAGVTPYMFPIILENPDRDFPRLKELCIPMWRWEEIIRTECPVSKSYRTQLIQLPCHEDITRVELNWIISSMSKILS